MNWFDKRYRFRSLGLASAAALVAILPAYALPTASADDADSESGSLSIAQVRTATADERDQLIGLDLDILEVTEYGAEVLLHDAKEIRALEGSSLEADYIDVTTELEKLDAARAEEDALEELLESNTALASGLPTGRVSYRTLAEAQAEIRQIAAENPDIVKLFEMPNPSLLGHPVLGLEISHDVQTYSGKPVFLTTGVHHAREWPTLELTLEFAWDVVQSDGVDPEITGLLEDTRLIVVPVVNPDGFYMSRERIQEMKRKNCRVLAGTIPTEAECAATANHRFGVDLNRNYASFWGGPGASGSVTAENHYGAHPYSEPEIQNTNDLMSSHQVMVALNNHTPDARLLRAPSSPLEPQPAEEEMYDALAQEIGGALDFIAGPWTEVYYVASGVAEQDGLYVNGTFGFTPELTPGHSGLERFHPQYEFVIDQYSGVGNYEGSSFREASMIAWRAAADPAKHSLITGEAPANIELTISKDVSVDSSPLAGGVVIASETELETTMRVPASGEFEWHVLPSLRQSQYASTLLEESWVVSCADADGEVAMTRTVTLARGQAVDLDLSACPAAGIADLDVLLSSFNADGTISDRTTASLRDRLTRAQALADIGSETRTIGYLEQFIARAMNQVKGNERDAMARDLLVQAAQDLIAELEAAEDAENS